MTVRVLARSMSRSVRERLQKRPPPDLHVLAVFDRACDLVSSGADCPPPPVIALVAPEVGDGPLNIVLDGNSWKAGRVEPGMRADTRGKRFQVGDLEIDLSKAEMWEPRPDWAALRSDHAAIGAALPRLRSLSLARAQATSLLLLLDVEALAPYRRDPVLCTACIALNALKEGWTGDPVRLYDGVAALAGLGSGLTPGGDDFLCGAMLWAWIACSGAARFCESIARAAEPRTTTLSAAFLWAAAQGECNSAWHALLEALAQGSEVAMALAVQDLLAYGATSGADALAGFLWAGTQCDPRYQVSEERFFDGVLVRSTHHLDC